MPARPSNAGSRNRFSEIILFAWKKIENSHRLENGKIAAETLPQYSRRRIYRWYIASRSSWDYTTIQRVKYDKKKLEKIKTKYKSSERVAQWLVTRWRVRLFTFHPVRAHDVDPVRRPLLLLYTYAIHATSFFSLRSIYVVVL